MLSKLRRYLNFNQSSRAQFTSEVLIRHYLEKFPFTEMRGSIKIDYSVIEIPPETFKFMSDNWSKRQIVHQRA